MKQWISSLVNKVVAHSLLSRKSTKTKTKASSHEPTPELALGHSVTEPYLSPYHRFLDHLMLREGVVYECYEDSLGKLTAGVGHLLPADTELGAGSPVPKEQVDQWLQEDSQLAWSNAISQARLLGRYDDPFIIGLASVNFQLGVHWNLIHKKTWHYLERGRWNLAASECADSLWNQQTPKRVADFQEAIMSSS